MTRHSGWARAVGRRLIRLPRLPALVALKLYKTHLSPEIRSRVCRFEPSCSVYAYEAIDRYGLVVGSFLAWRRLRRCTPQNQGGYDPVP